MLIREASMTVSRMLIAAFFALAAGIAVDNAKATATCPAVAATCTTDR
jgi:hypothetical protein